MVNRQLRASSVPQVWALGPERDPDRQEQAALNPER